MTEASLTAAFLAEARTLLPSTVVLKHSDRVTSGIPDVSITGYGRTLWLEMKHANPQFKTDGLQQLTMLRLANAGLARYIIWDESGARKETLILHPKNIKSPDIFEFACLGFDKKWLVAHVVNFLREPV